jgi:hypothetical protein
MNALIIGHGMKRDIDNAFFVFENFARLNLRPDANTFSFDGGIVHRCEIQISLRGGNTTHVQPPGC